MFLMSCCLYCSGPDLSAEDSEEAEKVGNYRDLFHTDTVVNAHAISQPV